MVWCGLSARRDTDRTPVGARFSGAGPIYGERAVLLGSFDQLDGNLTGFVEWSVLSG